MENFFKNLSVEDLARWIRSAAQLLAGSGIGIGILTGDKWVALGGILVSIVSFIFTLRGNTLAAKVAEVEKSPDIAKVVPKPSAPPAVKEAASG